MDSAVCRYEEEVPMTIHQPDPSKNAAQQESAFDLSSCVFSGNQPQETNSTTEASKEADVYKVHAASERILRDRVKERRLELVEQLEAMGTEVAISNDAVVSCEKTDGGATYRVRLTYSCGAETCFEINATDGSERNIGMTYFPITADSPRNASGWNRTGTTLSVDAVLDMALN